MSTFKSVSRFLALSALGLMLWLAFRLFSGVVVDTQFISHAATLKELGCYESLYFNNPCTDDLYAYCDSTGDGYYDSYYFLGKQGFGFEPEKLDMSSEESMKFYREVTECRNLE